MCYDDNARPPVPPGASGNARGEDLVLTAADGTRFMAYAGHPANATGRARVIIYPDVRGLHQFYKELALRFAEVGIPAVAIDYFGRTAGLSSRDESFEFMPHVQQIRFDSFISDVNAALDYTRSNFGADSAIFPVGFCMGGTLSLMSGTRPDLGFAGVIGFYSGITRAFGSMGTLLDSADKIVYPVLDMFGGADAGIPASAVQELEEKLNKAGIENTIITYPDAPHSFFDRRAEQYAEASADAWKQVLNFISAHSS